MKTDVVIGLQYGAEGTFKLIEQLLTYNTYTIGVYNACKCIEIPLTAHYKLNTLINVNSEIDTKIFNEKLNKHENIRKYITIFADNDKNT
jgi:hypothetical protein